MIHRRFIFCLLALISTAVYATALRGAESTAASIPSPADRDEHAPGDEGHVELRWTSPASAVKFQLYLASTHSAQEAHDLVAAATIGGDGFLGTFAGTRVPIRFNPAETLRHFAWRVDAVDAQGNVVRGEVWQFRPRRLAYLGAEGDGKYAIGGRGGRVIKVTTLDDDGAGSLREALAAEGPRNVVFDVGGVIQLKRDLTIRDPYLTVAGQTAPGRGVCLSGGKFDGADSKEAVIRFLSVIEAGAAPSAKDFPPARREANWDADDDGIPAEWERANELNVQSPAGDLSDANSDRDRDGFTNLEDYFSAAAAEMNAKQRARQGSAPGAAQ